MTDAPESVRSLQARGFRPGYNECPGCGGPKGYYAGLCAKCRGNRQMPNLEARQKRKREGKVRMALCGGYARSKAKREADPEWRCTRPAGWGTPHPGIGHCRVHGGMQPNNLINGIRVRAEMEMREAMAAESRDTGGSAARPKKRKKQKAGKS